MNKISAYTEIASVTSGQYILITESGVGNFKISVNDFSGQMLPSFLTTFIGWVAATAYQMTGATYDTDYVLSGASILWPDGGTGTYTRIVKNTDFLDVDSYSVTYIKSPLSYTVTQPTVTRDAAGNITICPQKILS